MVRVRVRVFHGTVGNKTLQLHTAFQEERVMTVKETP